MTDLKLKMERCDECKLSVFIQDHEQRYCLMTDVAYTKAPVDEGEPPIWCPIRGKVVTIEGPES